MNPENKIIVLLEDIAHKLSGSILEKPDYVERLYSNASSFKGTTTVLCDSGTSSGTTERQNAGHEQSGDAQVRSDKGTWIATAQAQNDRQVRYKFKRRGD